MPACSAATVPASAAASAMRSGVKSFDPGGSTSAPFHVVGIALAVRMHMIAVGPTISRGEEPVSAYARGAANPVSSPDSAGSPAMPA